MKIILVLIFLGLFVAIGFLMAFIWAVKSGQYSDDSSPALRVLLEEDMVKGKIAHLKSQEHSHENNESK